MTRTQQMALDLDRAFGVTSPSFEGMRRPAFDYDELIIDSFAGGGGASEGIRLATGRDPDYAFNHDLEAIFMHRANHPSTVHFSCDVWEVDPVEVCGGRRVGLMWLSPDCKHFSKAKGGKPVSKRVRGLAWVAVRWAKAVQPRVIVLENVEEFQTWGPLGDDGRPCKKRKGLTFKRFVGRLRNLGYVVEWREMRAADYGAPTTRKRLFLIARCDGAAIIWPEPTHGKGRPFAWRTAAECMDWAVPCPSIFSRKKPLAKNTLRRIAAGMFRFVIDSPTPFIVNMARGGKVESINEPISTIATEKGGCRALVAPSIINLRGTSDSHIDASAQSIEEPMRTISAAGTHAALVAPFLTEYYSAKRPGDDRVANLELPLPTQTTENRFGLIAPILVPRYGEREGQAPRARSLEQPMPVIVPTGNGGNLCAAYLARHYTGVDGASLTQPVSTITAIDHHSLVSAFLIAYYGNEKEGGACNAPMRTVTARERFGLVSVDGVECEITDIRVKGFAIGDIGMRMLQPRELFRGQGFRENYQIDVPFPYKTKSGKIRIKPLTKRAQTRMVGNSVCPPLARAIIAANVPEMIVHQAAA